MSAVPRMQARTLHRSRLKACIVLSVVLFALAAAANASAQPDELEYHEGKVVTSPRIHLIFWLPPTLQEGQHVAVPPNFIPTIKQFFSDLGGTGYFGVLTQYYEENNGVQHFIHNSVRYDGSYILDTSPYPNDACANAALHSSNCLQDGTVQNLIRKVIDSGVSAGDNEVFVVYTDPQEYVCGGISVPIIGNNCFEFQGNCAYHNSFHTGFFGTGTDVIYAVEPYQDGFCNGNWPQADPNGFALDAQLYSTSHEVTEAITNPNGDGWYGENGKSDEIGDKCNGDLGLLPMPYDYGHANELMYGHYYMLTPLFSNNLASALAGIGQTGGYSGCARNDEHEHLADVTPTPGFTDGNPNGAASQGPYGGPGEPVALAAEDFPKGAVVNVEYETGLPAPNDHVSLCLHPGSGSRTTRSDGTVLCTDHIPAEPAAGALGTHRIMFTTGSGRPSGINFHLEAGTISPWELQFGSAAVGTTTPPQTVTVMNASTTSSITINRRFSGGTAFPLVPQSTTCKNGTILGPGASCGIDVAFMPNRTGLEQGTLEIDDTGNRLTQKVKLEGTGTQSSSDCDNDGDPGDPFESFEC